MKNPPLIPEKISIHLLCELLSLSGMQEQAKLDALKQYSNESGLLFTFISMTEVKALPINIPIGDEYGENNGFIHHHDAKEESIEWFNCISFTLNQYFLSEGKATTCINWFKVDGELFHVINDDNNNVGDLFIDLSNVFVKKSDFINFINLIDESGDNALKTTVQNLEHPIQKNVKPISKAGHTQNTRFVEFEKYCKQIAIEKKLPDEEHQTIYDSFSPFLTKKDFYNELFEYNQKVFNGNESDFFRDTRVKIQFTKSARNK
jgi:hypothetical protein